MSAVELRLEPILVRPEDAAAALSISRDFFDQYVAPEVACVRRGRLKLYAVADLREWAVTNASRLADDLGAVR